MQKRGSSLPSPQSLLLLQNLLNGTQRPFEQLNSEREQPELEPEEPEEPESKLTGLAAFDVAEAAAAAASAVVAAASVSSSVSLDVGVAYA